MTPAEFISKWSRREGTERQTAQEHFIDLCHVLVVMVRHRREVYR